MTDFDFAAKIDERSTALNAEFKEHWAEVVEQLGPQDRDSVFCGWALQKIASLQVLLEYQSERLNELGALTLPR